MKSLHRLGPVGRWGVLLLVSVLMSALFQAARLPAALLLGPLVAAVLVQQGGGGVKLPRILLMMAQAVIGCLVAQSITHAILIGFVAHWPLFLSVVLLSVAASVTIGWGMSRLRVIPGTTAVWGMLPGAATVMVVMAEAWGEDFRLVAFMQYLRVVLVAAVASVVALMVSHGGGGRFSHGYFPPVDLHDFAMAVAVGLAGAAIGLAIRLPAGVLLGPLVLGGLCSIEGWVHIELPPVLLIASYASIGWSTGLRFTREVLAASARALPKVLVAMVLQMACCGLLALVLTLSLGIDPLTAYLATTPGGVDAAVIIASTTHVDMSFVMALQLLRVLLLMFAGPHIARGVAATVSPRGIAR